MPLSSTGLLKAVVDVDDYIMNKERKKNCFSIILAKNKMEYSKIE